MQKMNTGLRARVTVTIVDKYQKGVDFLAFL